MCLVLEKYERKNERFFYYLKKANNNIKDIFFVIQLADAYEEVEEQRQVVGQWKRRVQKLNGEMHDLRLLLEEQTARNNLLEKKQRK